VVAFDVFLSYAHADRDRVIELCGALVAQGLAVWLDEARIETFESISGAVSEALARSKALVAFYSRTYPMRRACQWELTAAFLAAQEGGHDPRKRVLVVNPEEGIGHVEPIELRDALYAALPSSGNIGSIASSVAEHVASLDGVLGELGPAARAPWVGRAAVRATRFVGRERDMWAVHSALHAADVAVISGAHRSDPAVKVTGMGGIGKTMLAQEYAMRFANAHRGGVFWLRAHGHDDRGETLMAATRSVERDTQMLEFARELGLATADLPPRGLRGALADELDRRAEPFLWVVDDIPPGLTSADLEAWYAPGRFGTTLMTTRSREYHGVGAQLDLGVLSAQEGYELLLKHRVPEGPEELAAARGLVADLGAHALAVDVAGAALAAAMGVRSFAQYRADLRDPANDVLGVAAGLAGELPDGHDASIAATLTRSIRQLTEPARDVLRLASRLASDPVPASLVVRVFARVQEISEEEARNPAVAAMHEAVQRSLADLTEDGSARRVHTLISRTISLLEHLSPRADALAGGAVDVLSAELGGSSSRGVSADAVTLAHARHLTTTLGTPRHAALLNAVAVHDQMRGDYGLARSESAEVLAAYQRLLGFRHLDTLNAMNTLAEMLRWLGDYAAARSLQEQTLAVYRRSLGEQHPTTLMTISNLALSLSALGDHRAARALDEQTLVGLRRVLGDEHPSTLATMNNLALAM